MLRARRERHEADIVEGSDDGLRARVMASLCELLAAGLLDHGDSPGPQLALAAAWIDALNQIEHSIKHDGHLDPDEMSAFCDAVDAQLSSYSQAATLPGVAAVLLVPKRRTGNRMGPFEELARRLRHKGAIDALQRELPAFNPSSPLVDAAMDRAVEAARRTGKDAFPDGRDRIDRIAVLTEAADAVEGLAMARHWLERVDDPLLHPGSTILFSRVERRLGAARALAALDDLRVRDATDAMKQLRASVAEAVETQQVRRAIDLLVAHGPALETSRALLQADDLRLNRLGRSIVAQVGRSLPDAQTVALLDRMRRVGELSGDLLADDLIESLIAEGDVSEVELLRAESMGMESPIDLHTVPSMTEAQRMLERRRAGA
ncbi:MAG: hypothetical protein MK101_05245 [Phycisphaerales bacterium]|nr:hypothetical protein [Phycisphaerales bacterium]